MRIDTPSGTEQTAGAKLRIDVTPAATGSTGLYRMSTVDGIGAPAIRLAAFGELTRSTNLLVLDDVDTRVVTRLAAAAEEKSGETAGERFTAWLRAFLDFSTSKRQLVAELLVEDDDRSVFNENRARVMAAGNPSIAAVGPIGKLETHTAFARRFGAKLAAAE